MHRKQTVRLENLAPEEAERLAALVQQAWRADSSTPARDAFVYRIEVDGESWTVSEPDLDEATRELIEFVSSH